MKRNEITNLRSALLSFPLSGWRSEALEEAAQVLGNMSSVALAVKQHTATLAYIELLQSVVKGTDSMRWGIILCQPNLTFTCEARQSLKSMKNGNRSVTNLSKRDKATRLKRMFQLLH